MYIKYAHTQFENPTKPGAQDPQPVSAFSKPLEQAEHTPSAMHDVHPALEHVPYIIIH